MYPQRMLLLLRCLILTILVLAVQLSGPFPAYALQTHGYKGLYVHQGAHLFFLFAMLMFIYRIHRLDASGRKQWCCMGYGAWFLALWNLWAFTGHFIELLVPADHIRLLGDDPVPALTIASWRDVAFYILKMDHLISVPAILCFYVGLKTIVKDNNT